MDDGGIYWVGHNGTYPKVGFLQLTAHLHGSNVVSKMEVRVEFGDTKRLSPAVGVVTKKGAELVTTPLAVVTTPTTTIPTTTEAPPPTSKPLLLYISIGCVIVIVFSLLLFLTFRYRNKKSAIVLTKSSNHHGDTTTTQIRALSNRYEDCPKSPAGDQWEVQRHRVKIQSILGVGLIFYLSMGT